MSIGIAAVLNSLASHAQQLGFFETVLTHEPKSAPTAPACAFFVSSIVPFPERSGLTTVSITLTVSGRIYGNMLQEPQDDIDRDVVLATDALVSAYVADFDLGVSAEIDVFGQHSDGLRAEAGYLQQDSVLFRVMDLQIPITINDVWTEAA